jgi:hypothetical protein
MYNIIKNRYLSGSITAEKVRAYAPKVITYKEAETIINLKK